MPLNCEHAGYRGNYSVDTAFPRNGKRVARERDRQNTPTRRDQLDDPGRKPRNGTLKSALDVILPVDPPDDRARTAVVSTRTGDWPSVPEEETMQLYRDRCTLLETRDVNSGGAVEVSFPG